MSRCLLTVVLLQQLYSSEQHGSVLGVSDVQLIQVFLLQQLERVQVLIAVEQESGHVLLQDRGRAGRAWVTGFFLWIFQICLAHGMVWRECFVFSQIAVIRTDKSSLTPLKFLQIMPWLQDFKKRNCVWIKVIGPTAHIWNRNMSSSADKHREVVWGGENTPQIHACHRVSFSHTSPNSYFAF